MCIYTYVDALDAQSKATARSVKDLSGTLGEAVQASLSVRMRSQKVATLDGLKAVSDMTKELITDVSQTLQQECLVACSDLIHIHIQMYMYICICVYICIYMCSYTYPYMYMYIYICK